MVKKIEKRQKLEIILIGNFRKGSLKKIAIMKYISHLIYSKTVEKDKYTNLKIKLTNNYKYEQNWMNSKRMLYLVLH